jgi:hypothetical protein
MPGIIIDEYSLLHETTTVQAIHSQALIVDENYAPVSN